MPSNPQESTGDVGGLIERERERQIAKGYDAAHDDQHRDREIIVDPNWGAYVRLDNALGINDPATYQRELIQVAAMIISEIERSRREVQQ